MTQSVRLSEVQLPLEVRERDPRLAERNLSVSPAQERQVVRLSGADWTDAWQRHALAPRGGERLAPGSRGCAPSGGLHCPDIMLYAQCVPAEPQIGPRLDQSIQVTERLS